MKKQELFYLKRFRTESNSVFAGLIANIEWLAYFAIMAYLTFAVYVLLVR